MIKTNERLVLITYRILFWLRLRIETRDAKQRLLGSISNLKAILRIQAVV